MAKIPIFLDLIDKWYYVGPYVIFFLNGPNRAVTIHFIVHFALFFQNRFYEYEKAANVAA